MMKLWHKDNPKWALLLVALFTLGLCWSFSCSGAQAGNVNHRIRIEGDKDTTYIVWLKDGVLQDSVEVLLAQLPYDTTFVLSDVSFYQFYTMTKWTGDTKWRPNGWFFDARYSQGTGGNTHLVRVYDSANAQYVNGATVTIFSMGGVQEGTWVTNSSGEWSMTLGLDSFKFVADYSGYLFFPETTLVAGDDTTLVQGYKTTTTIVADTAGRCQVYGTVTDAWKNVVRYADVVFTLPSKVVFDDCDSTMITTNIVYVTTNASGVFQAPLIKSSCIDDKAWSMTVTYKETEGSTYTLIENRPITVPDSTSYLVVF